LRFFFSVTLDRADLARRLTVVRLPRRLPGVLSVEEVALLLQAAPGPKYKAALPPPGAQQFEQLRRQHGLSIFTSLAALDPQQHALGIDIADLAVPGSPEIRPGYRACAGRNEGALLSDYRRGSCQSPSPAVSLQWRLVL
jgi:hypothetical protein